MSARLALSLAPVVFAWVWTWWHLAAEWRAHPHYEYGWGVPLLFALLVWRAWPGEVRPLSRGAGCGALVVAGGLVWTLGEAIRQHDPIWRLAGALLAAGSTLIGAGWLLSAGGRPLLWRQALPLLFAWTAVPWPIPLEFATTQRLLHFVTSAAVFCLTVAGVPALQRGSVIELAVGPVGVSDACSGLQSLQAALMVSLFLSGIHRLAVPRTLLLIGLGCGVAIFGNLLRVLALVAVATKGGAAAVERWHDPAGMLATVFIFTGAAWCAAKICPGEPAVARPIQSVLVPSPRTSLVLLALLGAIVLLLDFAHGRPAASPRTRWKIDASRLPEGWKAEPRSPTRREWTMLRFEAAEIIELRAPGGRSAWLYHFSWEDEGMPPFAFSHTPGMCLPWQGWKPDGPPHRVTLRSPAGDLPAMAFSFAQGPARVVAFQILAAGGKTRQFTDFEPNVANRLRRLVAAWREPRERIDEELLLYLPANELSVAIIAAEEALSAVTTLGR